MHRGLQAVPKEGLRGCYNGITQGNYLQFTVVPKTVSFQQRSTRSEPQAKAFLDLLKTETISFEIKLVPYLAFKI